MFNDEPIRWSICGHPCLPAHKPFVIRAVSIQSLEEVEIVVHDANVAMRPESTKKRWLIDPNLADCNINHASLASDLLGTYVGFPAREYSVVIPAPLFLTPHYSDPAVVLFAYR